VRLVIRLIFSVLLVAASLDAASQSAAYIVANPPDGIDLSAAMLEDALHGRVRSWSSGDAIVVVLPGKKSLEQDEIAEKCFSTSARGLQREWLRLVFSGMANAPVFTDSPADTIDYVSRTRGTIGLTTIKPTGEFVSVFDGCN